jgi:hypothetical protein
MYKGTIECEVSQTMALVVDAGAIQDSQYVESATKLCKWDMCVLEFTWKFNILKCNGSEPGLSRAVFHTLRVLIQAVIVWLDPSGWMCAHWLVKQAK